MTPFSPPISTVKRFANFVVRVVDSYSLLFGGFDVLWKKAREAILGWATAQVGTETAKLSQPAFWAEAATVLAADAPKLLFKAYAEWSEFIVNKYAKKSSEPFEWVVYMPTPADRLPNPSAVVHLPSRFNIDGVGVQLKFGERDQRGRLFGLGIVNLNTNPRPYYTQFFRMDYHNPKEHINPDGSVRLGDKDADLWIRGDQFKFHFHVLRNGPG